MPAGSCSSLVRRLRVTSRWVDVWCTAGYCLPLRRVECFQAATSTAPPHLLSGFALCTVCTPLCSKSATLPHLPPHPALPHPPPSLPHCHHAQVIRLSFVLPPAGEGTVLPRLLTLACLLIDLMGSYRLNPGERLRCATMVERLVAAARCGAFRSAAARAKHCAGTCCTPPLRCESLWRNDVAHFCPHSSIAMCRATEAGHGCAVQARGSCSRQRAGKRAHLAWAVVGGCLGRRCGGTAAGMHTDFEPVCPQTQNLSSCACGPRLLIAAG